jgi:mono/diheme cytochrome c family protein
LPRDVPRETDRLTAAFAAILLTLGGFTARAEEVDPVARGAYLAAAAGCDQCHTDGKSGGQAYAGGRALETPFGTIFTPNITPDRETGIGGWSFADFTRALRWGIAPDDSHYQPAFPFAFYSHLGDRDLTDLKIFLDSVPAVSRANTATRSGILAAARTRAAIISVAECFSGPWQVDATRDQNWNRGAYLVATVARCGDCHTPRNWLGVRNIERQLAGTSAGPGGKAVPNITPDPETGIGRWSKDDVTALLKDGQTPDFDFVGGAMTEIVKNTTRLTDADRSAIATYLRSLPAIHSESKADN